MASLIGFPDAFTGVDGTALGTYDAKYVVSNVANTGGTTIQSNAVRMRTIEVGAGYTAYTRFYVTGSARTDELMRVKFTVVDATKECYFTFFMRGSAGWTAGSDKQPTQKSYGITVRPATGDLDLSCYHADETYTQLALSSAFGWTTGHQYGLVARMVGNQMVWKLWDITASETEAAPKVTFSVDLTTVAAAEQSLAAGEFMVRLHSGAAATTVDMTIDDLDLDDMTSAVSKRYVGEAYVGSASVSTTSQNASSASSDTGPVALTQHNVLVVANATSGSSDGAVVLTQHNVLVVANATSGSSDNSPQALTQHYSITVANATSASSDGGVGTLTPHTALTVAAASSASSDGGVVLTQHNVLAAANASSASSSGVATLTQHNILAVANASSAGTADNVTLANAFSIPSDISGLLVWLDANAITGKVDGDTLTSWTDLSGGARHAVQATSGFRPTYKTGILNGKPVVRFDGVDDFLKAPVTDDATVTLVAVLKKRSPIVFDYQVGLAFGTPSSGSFSLLTHESYDANYVFYPNDGWGFSTGLGGPPETAQIVALRVNSTSSMDVFTAGNLTPVNINPQDDIALFSELVLGAAEDGGDGGDFDIAEVCLYNTALTSGGIRNVFAYLATKWAVGGPLALAPQNATSAHGAANVALTQHNVLVVANATSAHTATSPTPHLAAVYADNASSATTSGNVTLTASFAPTTLSGLLVWLDANAITGKVDGDAVSQWQDRSGGSRHANQVTPGAMPTYKTNVLNGKPVVRFDGTNDWMSAAVTDNASITIAAVLRKRSAVDVDTKNALALAEPNTGSHHFGTNSAYTPGFLFYPSETWGVAAVGGTPTTAQIVALRVNSTSSLDVFVGGSTSVALNLDPQDYIGGFTDLFLGSNAYAGDNGDFDIAEVVMYDSALSSGNLMSLFGYLGSKWLVSAPTSVGLVVANATSASASGNVVATQHNVLVVQNASSAHAVQNVATRYMIGAVDNCSSQMVASSAGTLTQHFPLTVANASSAQSASNCALVLHGVAQLVVASAMSMMAAEGCRLGVGLVPANCAMASSSSAPSAFLLHPRAPSGYTTVTGDGVRDSTEAVSKTKVT